MDARREWTGQEGQAGDLPQAGDLHEEVWLLGQSPLENYLDYAGEMAANCRHLRRSALVDEWREANDYYYELEVSEAGIADQVEIRDLPASVEDQADLVAADSRFQSSYSKLPTRFAMVELDRLIMAQPHVDLQHAERLAARLGESPTDVALFQFCQPLNVSDAQIQVRKLGSKRFLFWSQSSDFRFLEAGPLDPAIVDHDPGGPLGGVLGLMVGFGSNFLNAVQSDARLLLRNGHHRAYAMRALGITHAPCIIQTVTRRDELNLVASRRVAESPHYYFAAARPPLLKDFFDPRIRKVLSVPRVVRAIELTFEVRDFEVVDFATVG